MDNKRAVVLAKLVMALGRQKVHGVSDASALAYVKYNPTGIQVLEEDGSTTDIVSAKEINDLLNYLQNTEYVDPLGIKRGDTVVVTLPEQEPKEGEVTDIKYNVKGFGTKNISKEHLHLK